MPSHVLQWAQDHNIFESSRQKKRLGMRLFIRREPPLLLPCTEAISRTHDSIVHCQNTIIYNAQALVPLSHQKRLNNKFDMFSDLQNINPNPNQDWVLGPS